LTSVAALLTALPAQLAALEGVGIEAEWVRRLSFAAFDLRRR
jgi:hypothetical protein